MSNEPIEAKSYSQEVCEGMFELLDAYATDELDVDSQQQVGEHLTDCHLCQQRLAEIQHFRILLTSLSLDEQYHRDEVAGSNQSRWQNLRIADAVVSEIERQERKGSKQKLHPNIFWRHSSPANADPRKKRLFSPMGLLVASLVVIVLASTFFVVQQSLYKTIPRQPGSVPPPIYWQVQPGQASAQNASGDFGLEYIILNQKEFRFFYALRTNHPGLPHVQVSSYVQSSPNKLTALATTVQPLGQLGPWNVGVIHATSLSRAHQIITLQVFVPGERTAAWHLEPLIQLRDDLRGGIIWRNPININQGGHSTIYWYGPVMQEQVAFFRYTALRKPPVYIFVSIADPTTVQIISKAQYLAIAGKQNFF
jgi:hypothetical protein